jgi:D-aspartate ligase
MSVGRPVGALILGADYRALGAARSLGRRGVPVWLVAEKAEPIATVSRYARHSVQWPDGDDARRVAFLRGLAVERGLRGWALIPSSDTAAALVSRAHGELAEYFVNTIPAWDVLRWAYDKRLTHELAERLGVPCPHTVRVGPTFDPAETAVSFPAVLKPAIKEQANALTTAKAWRIEDRADLVRRFEEARDLLDPDVLMIQQLITGGGEAQLSFAALCRDGEPVAWLTARRTRQYPADFGRASTFVETVNCPDIVEPSLRLLTELRYTGLIEVEYKRDPADGVVKLLDMNPRLWGWHSLSAGAGIDFPWLMWQLLCGGTVPLAHARAGVGWWRFSTDTPTAIRELLGRRLSAREYVRTLRRPRVGAIFAWDDPLPGLVELPLLAYVLARRILAGEAV